MEKVVNHYEKACEVLDSLEGALQASSDRDVQDLEAVLTRLEKILTSQELKDSIYSKNKQEIDMSGLSTNIRNWLLIIGIVLTLVATVVRTMDSTTRITKSMTELQNLLEVERSERIDADRNLELNINVQVKNIDKTLAELAIEVGEINTHLLYLQRYFSEGEE